MVVNSTSIGYEWTVSVLAYEVWRFVIFLLINYMMHSFIQLVIERGWRHVAV